MQKQSSFPQATQAGLLCIVAGMLGAPAHADHIEVFLLGGQSNMDGRAPASGLPTTPVNLQQPQADILFYEGGSLRTLRPDSGTDFGPEITFGRTIADADPAKSYGLIKYGVGGTSLDANWDPATGSTYTTFRNTVTNGLNALTNAGHTYEVVGMLWTQGERDAKTNRTTPQYEFDLNEFIADIRTRYGTDLPFFISRLSDGQTDMTPTQLTNIRTAQSNVAASDPFAYLIDTDGFGIKGDNLHLDANGQIALGEAFAQAYLGSLDFAIAGDADGDGDVDDSDLAISFSNYTGPVGSLVGKTAAQGDNDGDGDVDDGDLAISFSGYTGPLSPASVPEPGSLAVLTIAGLALGRRRRASWCR